ncbi:MAG: bile acid:sodium symporter family protein [Cyclobacteriaceae bacterium]
MNKKVLNGIINAFPVWVIFGSILSLYYPEWFVWFKPYIAYGLAVIMLGMGLTLNIEDFKRVFERPKDIALASLFQFTIMPLLGWALGYIYGLDKALAVGMIMVACCPGGTSSNVICYLARVDVALSVSMTAFSTLLAVIMTPLLTTLLIGNKVEVSALNLFLGTAKIVLIPVLAGIGISRYFPKASAKIVPFSPLFALAAIFLIIGVIIGEDRSILFESGFKLIASVTTLHAFGFLIGYLISKVFIKNEEVSRTVGLEVSMQNSGLGAVLAKDNFPLLLGVAAPCAIASSVHNIIGSILVAVFRKWPAKDGHAIQTNDKTT